MKRASLIIFICALQALGATFYVSPNGSGTVCSSASPCAISRINAQAQPGDLWVLKNGIFNGSGSVLSIFSVSGTSAAHIRVTAENPGGAIIQGDGAAGHVLQVVGQAFWDFDNLVVRNRDNSGNTGSNASIVATSTTASNITFRKMVATDGNTYGNNDAVLLQGTNILLEDTDILRSARNYIACYPTTTSKVTIRRVYVGQPIADHSASGPPDGIVMYGCRDSLVENSIAEGLAGYGFNGWGNGNRNFGSIARANNGGLFNGASSNIPTSQGDNFTLKDFVSIDDTAGVGVYLRPPHATVSNITLLRNIFAADSTFIASAANLSVTNALVKDTSGSGFFLDESALAFSTKSIAFSQAWNTGGINGGWTLSNTPPSPPGDVDPNLGSCIISVPSTGAFKGKGQNGADVGANVIYAYQDGVLTGTPLWDASTGAFRFGPPVVAGVNDPSTGLVRSTLHQRLAVLGCLPGIKPPNPPSGLALK